jgi:cytochrome c oxidase assembly factor CtaG
MLLVSTASALTSRSRHTSAAEYYIPVWTNWSHYHNYTEIVDTLIYLNTTYPSIVDVFPIGQSWQNQTIYCIRLTNENITYPKPKVFFVGYHHARKPSQFKEHP